MTPCNDCGEPMNPVQVALSGREKCGDCIDKERKRAVGVDNG